MAFYEDFEKNLYDATEKALEIAGHTGVPIRIASVDSLEPGSTYCIINVIELEQKGRVNEDSVLFIENESAILHTTTHYGAHVQYSILGANARIVAPDLRQAIVNNRACFMAFAERNFGILDRSRIRNIPQKRETQWVDCFNFDVELSFALRDKQQMNWVEWVKINDDWIPDVPPTIP